MQLKLCLKIRLVENTGKTDPLLIRRFNSYVSTQSSQEQAFITTALSISFAQTISLVHNCKKILHTAPEKCVSKNRFDEDS